MSELFYREDRDTDFFNVCEKVRSENVGMSVFDIVSIAIFRPAQSFYLHRREYSNIIRTKGDRFPKNKTKRELHLEILKRYHEIKNESPTMSIGNIVKIISEQKAPRFYLSRSRAANLYYELLKQPNRI
jgi:hypothetical protein